MCTDKETEDPTHDAQLPHPSVGGAPTQDPSHHTAAVSLFLSPCRLKWTLYRTFYCYFMALACVTASLCGRS